MTTVAPITTTAGRARERRLPAYLLAGVAFGIVLTKGELVSWFRIQEALRFKGLYLYEVFASALAVTIPAFALLKRRAVRSLSGEPIAIPPKVLGRDRKSTRLNSSHVKISYAVFCLKKKKKGNNLCPAVYVA